MYGVQPVGANDYAYDVFVVDDDDEDDDDDNERSQKNVLGDECGRLLRAQQQLMRSSDAEEMSARKFSWLPSRSVAWASMCVAVWFTCSISLTVYNKWLFNKRGGKASAAGFPFPVTVTCFHMFSNATLAWMVHFNPCVRSWRFDLESLYASEGSFHGNDAGFVSRCCSWLPPRSFLLSVLSVSVISGLDIALTNTSFIYLPASLVEVIKPSNVLFVLLFGLLLGLRRLNRLVVCSIAMIVGGQVLITSHAARFDWKGFEIVLAAVVMSAMKVTLLEVLLHGGVPSSTMLKLPRKLNAVEAMAFTMPGAGVILAGAVFLPYKSHSRICEDYPRWCITDKAQEHVYVSEFELLFGNNDVNDSFRRGNHELWARFVSFVLIGASMAFLLNVSELAVVACTDSLTTSLLGVLKLIMLFVATNLLLGETMSFWQIMGVSIVLVGMIVYRSALAAGAQAERLVQEEVEIDSEAKSRDVKKRAMKNHQSSRDAQTSSSSKHSTSLFTLEEYDDEDGSNGIELVGLIKNQSGNRKR